jgi:archaellum biogenesis protein FlaJ (TadC family)
MRLHRIKLQKTAIFILVAVKLEISLIIIELMKGTNSLNYIYRFRILCAVSDIIILVPWLAAASLITVS